MVGLGVGSLSVRFGKNSGEFRKHVFRRGDALGKTIANKAVRSHGKGFANISWNREHFLVEIEGQTGGNEASRIFGRFGNEGSGGICRDKSVSDGEIIRERGCFGWKARHDPTFGSFGYSVEQWAVFGRIIHVDARTDDGNGRPARIEGFAMGDGIDSIRAARNDRPSVLNERPGKTAGNRLSVGRRLARPDDRNRSIGRGKFPPEVQKERWAAERGDALWVPGAPMNENSRSYSSEPVKGSVSAPFRDFVRVRGGFGGIESETGEKSAPSDFGGFGHAAKLRPNVKKVAMAHSGRMERYEGARVHRFRKGVFPTPDTGLRLRRLPRKNGCLPRERIGSTLPPRTKNDHPIGMPERRRPYSRLRADGGFAKRTRATV